MFEAGRLAPVIKKKKYHDAIKMSQDDIVLKLKLNDLRVINYTTHFKKTKKTKT